MVECVESVVVGDHDVGVLVEEEGEHVVALLRDGVVQRSVALRILNNKCLLSKHLGQSIVDNDMPQVDLF